MRRLLDVCPTCTGSGFTPAAFLPLSLPTLHRLLNGPTRFPISPSALQETGTSCHTTMLLQPSSWQRAAENWGTLRISLGQDAGDVELAHHLRCAGCAACTAFPCAAPRGSRAFSFVSWAGRANAIVANAPSQPSSRLLCLSGLAASESALFGSTSDLPQQSSTLWLSQLSCQWRQRHCPGALSNCGDGVCLGLRVTFLRMQSSNGIIMQIVKNALQPASDLLSDIEACCQVTIKISQPLGPAGHQPEGTVPAPGTVTRTYIRCLTRR